MSKFTVDTKLFRELGELLVGRESTAMAELIKNAYDADARLVRIYGEKLGDPKNGLIAIQDDGIGMTLDIFERGFLTIAGRTKTEAEARSPIFKRRYTGEKGVGRLSAHKLASLLIAESHRWDGNRQDIADGLRSREGVLGQIDWDQIEEYDTLDEVAETDALQIKQLQNKTAAGTKLTLRRLRRSWSKRHLESFFADVATLVPAEALVEALPTNTVSTKMLFSHPRVHDARTSDPGFKIEYGGDFRQSATDLPALSEAAFWVIEIVCDAEKRQVSVAVEPTKAALRHEKFGAAEGWRGSYAFPKNADPVGFTARIYEREHTQWPRVFQGVRVYLEGFRVPPYGDTSDDWLDLGRDYRSRGKGELQRLKRFTDWKVPPDWVEEEGLDPKGNPHYFGAVFLTRESTPTLKMLVNREGFVPSPAWEFVYDVVRFAIGVQVRQRALARSKAKQSSSNSPDRDKRREYAKSADDDSAPSVFHARALQKEAAEIVREIRNLASAGNAKQAAKRLDRLEEVVLESEQLIEGQASDTVMFRVLASVGLEQATFVHEILGLGLTAETIASVLERLSKASPGDHRKQLRELTAEAIDLRERLRRNAVYLSDMTGVTGRKRRSRIKLRDRFEPTMGFFENAASRRKVIIKNEIPDDLISPPVFPAEVSALFSNILSNAIKFAGSPGRVQISGRSTSDEVIIRIENTGVRVDLRKAETWFEPFRSTTTGADASLGQGMGLGLTVSRSLMDEYGGTIEFVAPSSGYATALELRWPKR